MIKNAACILLGLFVFKVAVAQVPTYPIIQLTQPQNSNFQPDSLGVHARITGTVYGINVHAGGGYEFLLCDATAGIEIFSTNTFGYTVHEGDSLIVQGVVAFYSGITQLQTLDTLIQVGTGTLMQPVVVHHLDESTESELVRINNLTIPNPAQWSGTGNGFDCTATDGVSNYTIFVYKLSDLYAMAAPTGTFDLIGIGSQFTSHAPYNTGYTITPRYHQDIIAHPAGVTDVMQSSTSIYPNPNNGQFTISFTTSPSHEITVYDVAGQAVYGATATGTSMNVDIRHLASGMYVVESKGEEGISRSNVCVR